jgi:transcriptional repressor NrdR
MVIKRDGRKEVYDVSKLRTGIERAIQKRPIEGTIADIVARIEQKMFGKGAKEA